MLRYANSATLIRLPQGFSLTLPNFGMRFFHKGISFVFCIVKMTKIAKFGRVGERPSVVRI